MQVASLRYEVIFKKAFCDVEVFKAFVKDFLGIDLKIDKVETEKKYEKPIGNVDSRFDLHAEDLENRVIVDIQHRRYPDHYDRFLHYHCAALLQQVENAKNYSPNLTVFTIVVSTSGTKEDVAMAEINFDPIDCFTKKALNKIHHRILYISPKHVNENTPEPYRQWLELIKDSLDEEIDETIYHKHEILKVVDLIKRDGLTPQDRARMKDEYSEAELREKEKAEDFKKGQEKGRDEGIEIGIEKGKLEIAKNLLAQGLPVELIEQTTGISRQLFLND
ncbi:Rpn family recombination-promoting nuclease/putative transposase [Beggiatoa leptomitoformis]|uniref:Rpn family recombination-promoting nuclease/putative transposase n=1 Tax=Beggiatoa leptomitoformis TaxID=288004 RepID=A0A2N9YDK8_9GAMM|nr:Rpn family recombination-promoting nuclease/putative transposase [Beggiatoa leptomitoformis]ALG69026.1 Rpn family recombination-promoting nuclease/putative transposase [Beggiatoa leptomitoformis]AUI68570.1 Rpn family recombination-promoting nuclease/putative transposase [Beggiatoa leptomitoformis]